MISALKKLYLAGLGAITLTKEKAEELVDELVKKGQVKAEEKKSFVENILKAAEEKRKETQEFIKKEIQKVLKSMEIPTKKDVENIVKKRLEMHRKSEHKITE
ncbi:MAG: hypothetical protein H0Z29_01915 [Candidatus Marinimicrobia bacterium]|nr:hypothetical protein [Candidatus Neomarinimicrobiota bacterium]